MLIGSRRSVRRVTNGIPLLYRGVVSKLNPQIPKYYHGTYPGAATAILRNGFKASHLESLHEFHNVGGHGVYTHHGKQPEYPSERFSVIKWSIILFCSVWVRRPHPLHVIVNLFASECPAGDSIIHVDVIVNLFAAPAACDC